MMPDVVDVDGATAEIRAKVVALARSLGIDARNLRDDENIPESGALDSAGIMELIMWYEGRYGLSIDQADLTLENFGTVRSMAEYLRRP